MMKITNKDVQIAYYTGGIDAIRELNASTENGITRKTMENAQNSLQEAGQDVLEFSNLVTELCGESSGERRGRSVPTVGNTRNYIAQKVKDGGVFLRLPLNTLGITKGQTVQVAFNDEELVITCATRSTKMES